MSTALFGYVRNERVYFLSETTYGTTPAVSGVSTLNGADCCSIITCEMDPVVDLYDAEYKTGSRSIIPGQAGRKMGTFRLNMPLKGSGVPGVPPDYAPVMLSAFGSQTITSGVNVYYQLVDTPASTFSMFRYRQPSALYQQLGISCIPTRVTWNVGQNMANWSMEGECFWVLDSEQFNTADSFARGGLTTFPAEPVNPVTNGTQSQGFIGTVTAAGTTILSIQQMTVTAELGWSQDRTTFGRYYPADVLGGIRRVTVTMDTFDDNSTVLKALRVASLTKATINLFASVGTVAGNTHVLQVNNVQLSFPQLTDNAQRFGQRFQNIVAHESVPGSKDELIYTCF